jgi:hypothetical protein
LRAGARIAPSAAGIDRPCPRPGTDRSGNSRPSRGDVSLPSGEAVTLSRPRTRCGSARLRDWR